MLDRIYLVMMMVIGIAQVSDAQSFTSSDLPIVIIDSQNQSIQDEPKTPGTISIIYNGANQRNHITDTPTEYTGNCGIEIRGESSQIFAKKSFLVEMWDTNGNDIDTSFLNFPSEEDFILYGPYSDKTLMNNVLTMDIGNKMGHYASRTRYVELVINEDYRGVYVLMEKIKRDKNRVDISKLKPTDIQGDELTGGYIFRIDKGDHEGWTSNYNMYNSGSKLRFQFYYPDPVEMATEQKVYIAQYMNRFEDAIVSSDFHNSEGHHYTHYIHLRSFVDQFIMSELSKDVDAYRLSSYFHKDKDSKDGRISAGPFWDYNLAFGNADYCTTANPTGFIYFECPGSSPFWWARFLVDDTFTSALKCRWTDLRSSILSDESLLVFIDSQVAILEESQERNFDRWPILGTYVWPNPPFFENPNSHKLVVDAMKDWLLSRLSWLDDNMYGTAVDCDQYDDPHYEFGVEVATNEITYKTLTLSPNPTSNYITLSNTKNISHVVIYNLLGQMIYKIDKLDDQKYIDVSNLKDGHYILQGFDGNNHFAVPFVKVR